MDPEGFVIQIRVMPNLQVVATTNIPTRQLFLMAMEITKIDLERKMHEKEQQKIELPPPGLIVPRM